MIEPAWWKLPEIGTFCIQIRFSKQTALDSTLRISAPFIRSAAIFGSDSEPFGLPMQKKCGINFTVLPAGQYSQGIFNVSRAMTANDSWH
jgi:hypothetical protein